jgi:chemotaxis protein histidine kinase CheA
MSEAIPAPAGESIFTVDTLLKYMGNDDKALAVVSKIVRDACAPGMAPFELAGAALREDRLAEAGKIFHTVRGSIGALGAKRLVTASLKLEQAIAAQDTAAIPALFAATEAEYQLVLRDAAEWLQRSAQPSA